MKNVQNNSSPTHLSRMVALVGIVGIVLGASACQISSKGNTLVSPAFIVNHGKIYVAYTSTSNQASLVNDSFAVFRIQDGKRLWQDPPSTSYVAMEDATTAYIETSTMLSARDPESGKERWHTPIAVLPIAIQDGILYAHDFVRGGGTNVGQFLFAFEESTGKQLWAAKLPGQIQEMLFLIDSEHIFVHTREMVSSPQSPMQEMVSTLRTQDGKFLWSSSLTEPDTSLGGSTLLSSNGVLYVVREGSTEVDAFRASDGKLLWRFRQASEYLSLQGITDGILVIGTREGLSGLRANDGKQLWSRPLGSIPAGSGRVLADKGSLYVYSSAEKGLIALQAQDGKEKWRVGSLSNPGEVMDLDVTTQIIFISDGTLSAAVRTNGSLLWKVQTGSEENLVDDQIADGIIYRLIPEGLVGEGVQHFTQMHLIALRGSNGKTLWDTFFRF